VAPAFGLVGTVVILVQLLCTDQVVVSKFVTVPVECSSVGFGPFSSFLISLFGSKQNAATSTATDLFQSLINKRELSYGSTSEIHNGVASGLLGMTRSGNAPRTIGNSFG
jgi:hypothetical protein